MTRKLVFIHGRAQQNKDAVALKAEWGTALCDGLAANSLTLPIPDTDIRFPYYGDTLDQLAHGADPETAAQVIIRGSAPAGAAERKFIQEVTQEIAANLRITAEQIDEEIPSDVIERGPLNWSWVQAVLRVIDRRVPFGSGGSVALFTRDVYRYLTSIGIRDQIESGVLQAIASGEPAVVVAHSLGSVVGYNLLRREGQSRHWEVPVFITVGCPLGVEIIRRTLAPLVHPKCVGRWLNARDPHDVVALYPLEPPRFGVTPVIENKNDVRNPTPNRHGISGYLSDPTVARWIYESIVEA